MTEPEKQTVYRVEKFIPTRCPNPKCYNEFKQSGKDGYYYHTYWMHEPREVTEQVQQSIHSDWVSTDLIVCAKCQNVTLRVQLEEWVFATRGEAELALLQGFANLQEMIAYGIPPLGHRFYLAVRTVDEEPS